MKFSHEHFWEGIAINCARLRLILSHFRPKSAETCQEFAAKDAIDALVELHCQSGSFMQWDAVLKIDERSVALRAIHPKPALVVRFIKMVTK